MDTVNCRCDSKREPCTCSICRSLYDGPSIYEADSCPHSAYPHFNAMPRKTWSDKEFPGKPREWPYPIGIPQDLSYVAYHEIGNRPEKPKLPVSSLLSEAFDKTMDEIRERAMRVFALTSAELGMTEQTAEQRREKHTNDVIELYKNGLISVDEALRYLRNRPSPDAIFVSPKENPMSILNSTNPVTDLANRARDLAKDGKANLDSVKCAI